MTRKTIWIAGKGEGVPGNIPTHITLNWKPRFNSFRSICEVILSKPTWLRGKTVAVGTEGVVVVAIVKRARIMAAAGVGVKEGYLERGKGRKQLGDRTKESSRQRFTNE